jgi:hypothetical protein
VWWKVKKLACAILNRLFSRYGNPALLPPNDGTYAAFAENFVQNFAPQILQKYLQLSDLWIQKKQWLSDRVLHLLSEFFKDA